MSPTSRPQIFRALLESWPVDVPSGVALRGRMSLPVFFTPRMVAESGSFSPSAAKPAQVVASWRERGLPIEILEPAPVTIDQLARAHAYIHVEAILAGRTPNGFGNTSPEVAASLPFTSGAMLAGARHAIAHRTITCAPVSGFHHAGYRSAGGFCTFNGLMVTACALHVEDRVARVGILDCDMHYGDGTDDIIAKLDAASWVDHFTAGKRHVAPQHAAELLALLPARIRAMQGCEVVLYQAGADPHIDDPLGGMMTTAELRQRDEIVFETLAELGIPVVWNLAGGYQKAADGSIPAVLEIHENTARAALRALRGDAPK
jgi:acetoin utilization deacetylase AcuC-like enzyme